MKLGPFTPIRDNSGLINIEETLKQKYSASECVKFFAIMKAHQAGDMVKAKELGSTLTPQEKTRIMEFKTDKVALGKHAVEDTRIMQEQVHAQKEQAQAQREQVRANIARIGADLEKVEAQKKEIASQKKEIAAQRDELRKVAIVQLTSDVTKLDAYRTKLEQKRDTIVQNGVNELAAAMSRVNLNSSPIKAATPRKK